MWFRLSGLAQRWTHGASDDQCPCETPREKTLTVYKGFQAIRVQSQDCLSGQTFPLCGDQAWFKQESESLQVVVTVR